MTVVLSYGAMPTRTLRAGDIVRIFDWNTHKYLDPESLRVISRYAQNADVMTLQETMFGDRPSTRLRVRIKPEWSLIFTALILSPLPFIRRQ